jgi:hypothetical protein
MFYSPLELALVPGTVPRPFPAEHAPFAGYEFAEAIYLFVIYVRDILPAKATTRIRPSYLVFR